MAETKVEKAEKRSGPLRNMTEERKTPGRSNPISRYIRETRGELRKVTWPTREESQRLTAIVLAVTAVMAIFLGLLEFLFGNGVEALVRRVAGF